MTLAAIPLLLTNQDARSALPDAPVVPPERQRLRVLPFRGRRRLPGAGDHPG
jgi:hypothetical protein